MSEHPSVVQSKKWLLESLLDLMQDNSFQSIKITELTRNAQLDRSTFYKHFNDKEDLLVMKIRNIKDDYIVRLRSINQIDIANILDVFFNLCRDYLQFIVLLHSHQLDYLLLREFNNNIPYIYKTFETSISLCLLSHS